jgi:hypothetical protein
MAWTRVEEGRRRITESIPWTIILVGGNGCDGDNDDLKLHSLQRLGRSSHSLGMETGPCARRLSLFELPCGFRLG